MTRVLVLLLPLLLSGCVTELLGADTATVRTVTCAVLDPEQFDASLVVHQAVAAPVTGSVWIDAMASIAGRPGGMELRLQAGPDHDGPWEREALRDWWEVQDVLERDRVRLQVLWAPALEGDAVQNWAPGIVALDASVVPVGAQASGLEEQQVARALLLHGLGHSLGVVNAGIPLHGPDVAGREGPQHHEPDRDSVLHAGWHRASTMPSNVTLSYSDDIVADWQRAWQDGGVCVE